MYYIPGREDPKRTKVGDLPTASASIYTEDRCQQRNKADIMMLGLMGRMGRVSDSLVVF